MRIINILLKKDINERVTNLKNSKKDIMGVLLSAFLSLFVIGVFIYAFSFFTQTYAYIKVGYITATNERVFEILTIFYLLLFFLLMFIGISKLNKNLIDVGNLTLLSMPITPFQIFISKLFGVYLRLAFTSVLLSLPTFLMLIIEGLLAWSIIFVAFAFALIVPVVALCFASVFTIPYYFFKRWLNKHVVIQLITYIVLMIGAFIVYSIFLRFIKGLLETGQISFFFNESNIVAIGKISKALFPINIFSSLIIGNNIVLNIIVLIICVAISIAVCLCMSKFIFNLVSHNKIGKKEEIYVKKHIREPKRATISLMAKEYLNVLRTPNFALNYFAVVISLPLMVVITASLMTSMMKELTLLNCDFEIVLCSICMYSIILNSFCANNISRDGKFFNLLKTFPISPKKIVLSKVIFCSITSLVSIFLSGVAVLIAGILPVYKILAVVIICSVLNFGVICLATRKDLNTTKNKAENENSASANFLIFWGLLFAVVTTVISFVISLLLQSSFNLHVSNLISSAILFVLSSLVFVLALRYLLKNLDKKFKEIII